VEYQMTSVQCSSQNWGASCDAVCVDQRDRDGFE
jgi:hypothetical protein